MKIAYIFLLRMARSLAIGNGQKLGNCPQSSMCRVEHQHKQTSACNFVSTHFHMKHYLSIIQLVFILCNRALNKFSRIIYLMAWFVFNGVRTALRYAWCGTIACNVV